MPTRPFRRARTAIGAPLALAIALAGCVSNPPPAGPPDAAGPPGPVPVTAYPVAHGSRLYRGGVPVRLVVLDLDVDVERAGHEAALDPALLAPRLAALAGRGADTVRMGFAGRWVERDRAGLLDALQAAVDAADAVGLGTILQMRLPIGGNWLDPASPELDYSVWHDASLAERNARAWRAVAARFAGSPSIVAYDLLHAPVTDDDDGAAWRELAARLVAAVREADPERLIVVQRLHGARGLRERGDVPSLDELFVANDPNVLHDAGDDAPAPDALLPTGPLRLDADDPASAVRTTDVAPGTTGWTRVESPWSVPEHDDVDFGIAAVAVEGALGGRIDFDDLRVVERGADGVERVVLDASFDGASALDWSNRVDGAAGDTVDAARLHGPDGGTSLAVALRGTGINLRTGWSNPSAAFPVVPGAAYRVEGRVRGEAVRYLAGNGGSHAGFALGFVRRPRGGGPSHAPAGDDARARAAEPWLAFGRRHAVPVGSFGEWPARGADRP